MLDTRKFWLGIIISLVLLALFLVTVDVGRMLDALADADYLFLVPGVALYLVAVLFRTVRWKVMLYHMRPIGTARLFPVVVVGYMANNLLPMRLGELVRSYHVGEREGISKTSALATIFVERVMDALTLLFFISAIALFVPLTGLAEAYGERFGIAWPFLVVIFSAPFVVAFAALALFAFFPAAASSVTDVLIRRAPDRFEAKLRDLVAFFLQGLQPLRSPRTLALLFLLSVPVWLFESALFFLVGYSFGFNRVFDSLGDLAIAAVLVTAIANIGSSVPATPGGIGLFELLARETLVLLPMAAVDRSAAAGFAAVVHAALLLPMIVLGQVFLWTEHLSLRGLSRAERSGSTEDTSGEIVSRRSQGGALTMKRDRPK